MAKTTKHTALDNKLENIESRKDSQVDIADTILTGRQKDDDTRQQVAKLFVNAYFVLLALILIGVPTYNWLVYKGSNDPNLTIALKDTILTYSAVIGPTMGLVVAYYFENKDK